MPSSIRKTNYSFTNSKSFFYCVRQLKFVYLACPKMLLIALSPTSSRNMRQLILAVIFLDIFQVLVQFLGWIIKNEIL
jgi:hypothetical protein